MDQPYQPEPLTAPEPRGFLSQGQGDRFDRWVEFVSAIVLACATVLTAWCGYQAALWGGEQTEALNAANALRLEAAQQINEALLSDNRNVALFVEWAAAISQDNRRLADFLFQRFPPALRVATDAWIATKPLETAGAPPSPFAMAEYRLPQRDEARRLQQEAEAQTEAAAIADERSDRYVLLTVIFAMVFFFGGISGKFQWRVIDAAMLAFSILVIVGGLAVLITSPIIWA